MTGRSIEQIRADLAALDCDCVWRDPHGYDCLAPHAEAAIIAAVPGLLDRISVLEACCESEAGARAEAETRAADAEMRADNLRHDLSQEIGVTSTQAANIARLRAQVEAVTRDHFWREIDTRSDYCRTEGMNRPCESYGDPACLEACFETIRICNSCGTQDSCKIRAALSSVGPQPTEPKENQ